MIADVPRVRLHISATEMWLLLLYAVTHMGKARNMSIRHRPLRSPSTADLHRGGRGKSLSTSVEVLVDKIWCTPLLVDQSLGCGLMVGVDLLLRHVERVGVFEWFQDGCVRVLNGDGCRVYRCAYLREMLPSVESAPPS